MQCSVRLFIAYLNVQGPFSRYDYQRDSRHDRQPSVAGFKTLLPASARDVYYRDEIGNISTSAMRQHDEAVELVCSMVLCLAVY